MKWNNFRGNDSSGRHESNVEIEFYGLLQKARMNGEIPPFITREQIVLLWTEPDFCWTKERVALFFDGPPHDKAKQGAKDDIKNDYLTNLGWKVVRIKYNGKKVSQTKQAQVLEWIKEILIDSRFGHMWHYEIDGGLNRIE